MPRNVKRLLLLSIRILVILNCFAFLVKDDQDLLYEECLRRLEFEIRYSKFSQISTYFCCGSDAL